MNQEEQKEHKNILEFDLMVQKNILNDKLWRRQQLEESYKVILREVNDEIDDCKDKISSIKTQLSKFV